MTNFQTVLFDLDDTLIDFKSSERVSLKLCYERYFKTVVQYEVFLSDYNRINRHLWNQVEHGEISTKNVGRERFQQLMQHYQLPFNIEIVHYYEQELIRCPSLNDGALDLLEHLKMKDCQIGFVTNGLAHMQRGKYENLQLSRFSKILVISEDVGFAKPHPQIFQQALDLLEASAEETLMVGDSLTSDGEGARKLGMPFCWYNPKQNESTLPWQPELTIHHLSALKI